MADREIKITFPGKKMEALVFFLGEQNEKIEEVLTTHLDKTYEKYVPQQVRKFVDSQIAAAQEEAPVRGPGRSGSPENQGRQAGEMPDRARGRTLPDRRRPGQKVKPWHRRMRQPRAWQSRRRCRE